MKKLLTPFLLFIISFSDSYSQLPNVNTYLLRNLDVSGRSYAACWGYVAPNGREYAIIGYNTGTAFIDITDSANIREVDTQPGTSSSWREMKVYDHYAYIVSEAPNSRLQIVDLQYLPDSVHLVTTWSYAGYDHTHSISQSGKFLYLNGGNVTTGGTSSGGVAIVDLTNPIAPVKRGQWSNRYVHDCRVLNDTIWTANINAGKVTIINATNKDAPVEVRNWDNLPSPAPHNVDITRNRKYALVTDENTSPGKLKVWNVEDITNITFVTNWQPTGITTTIVHNVEIYGNYAVIAHYASGIRIVNITNPAVPTEAAWYDTRPSDNVNNYVGCWGVFKFPSGKIIGSDIANGLFVIKTTFPFNDVTTFNLKVSIEAMYNPVLNKLSRKDPVTVYLHDTQSPYSIIDSATAPIDSISFTGSYEFDNAPNDTYYVAVKHFNSIETWSKLGGVYLSNDRILYNYDFRTNASQAFGNNMKLTGSIYSIYSGDVNQDGIVDGVDLSLIDNDASNFVTGDRLPADLNADSVVDGSDFLFVDNNSSNFIGVSRP